MAQRPFLFYLRGFINRLIVMLSFTQLRSLLRALTGLIFSVSGLLLLTFSLFLIDEPDPVNLPRALDYNAPVHTPIAHPAGYEAGKSLFVNNCAQCHATTEETVIGPGLLGVRQRVPDDKWLYRWIRNSSALIASGDVYAKTLYKSFNQIQMTSFPQLTDEQINNLLLYIDTVGRESQAMHTNVVY